jgi:hypothetical protein
LPKPKSLTYPTIVNGDMRDPQVLLTATARMLAREAVLFAEYYGSIAERKKAREMHGLTATLREYAETARAPADTGTLFIAALMIANAARVENDPGLATEMTSLAMSIERHGERR